MLTEGDMLTPICLVLASGLSIRGRSSSVGRASDWKARRNTLAGSSPHWGKGRFFSQGQLPVHTPSVAFRHLPPKLKEGCPKTVLGVCFQCSHPYGVPTALVCNRTHQLLCTLKKKKKTTNTGSHIIIYDCLDGGGGGGGYYTHW